MLVYEKNLCVSVSIDNMSDDFDTDMLSFEFERKFFVRDMPEDVLRHGEVEVIAQAYLFAQEGYAVRIRLLFPGQKADFPDFDEAVDYAGAYERKVLAQLVDNADDDVRAVISVKSPTVTAERYEFEKDIDVDVAIQILRRSSNIVLKNRYSLWIGEDGWQIDVFGGQNDGLIMAECERLEPVVSLNIPDFCVTEVTGDLRFTNDWLSKEPWQEWNASFEHEFEVAGPRFLDI